MILLVYEFMYDHLFIFMLVFMIETVLRAIVCANFVSKVLLLKNLPEKTIFIFQVVYYIVIMGIIGVIFIISLFSKSSITCQSTLFSYHWFILDGIDFI